MSAQAVILPAIVQQDTRLLVSLTSYESSITENSNDILWAMNQLVTTIRRDLVVDLMVLGYTSHKGKFAFVVDILDERKRLYFRALHKMSSFGLQLQVDQVFTPSGHYLNIYVHGPQAICHTIAYHTSPPPPVQITQSSTNPPPPSYRKKWPVCTFALRYRIRDHLSIEPAADELRRAFQRSRVDVLVQVQSRFCQRVEDKTIDIEVIPLPKPVPPPSTMGIGSALSTTSLVPSVPTFAVPPPSTMGIGSALATTSLPPSVPTFPLPAKPDFGPTSLSVKPASSATTSLPASTTTPLVAPQPAFEDDDFGSHKRAISKETELKTHAGPKKRSKPVDVPPPPPPSSSPPSPPPSPPSSPLGPPPTSLSGRLPLAGVAVASGEGSDVQGGVTAASEDAAVVAEEVQEASVENVEIVENVETVGDVGQSEHIENDGNVGALDENVGNVPDLPADDLLLAQQQRLLEAERDLGEAAAAVNTAAQAYESARQVYESARKKLAVERVALMRLHLAEAERDLEDVS